MVEPLIIIQTPEQEAQDLMAGAARKVATMLAQGIARLGHPAGMGIAPPPEACAAAAERIVNIFGGAILAGCERDRFKRRLDRMEGGAPTDDVVALVTAARHVVESYGDMETSELRNLHEAAERFASRVCYDDEGGTIPEAHANPCTCGLTRD